MKNSCIHENLINCHYWTKTKIEITWMHVYTFVDNEWIMSNVKHIFHSISKLITSISKSGRSNAALNNEQKCAMLGTSDQDLSSEILEIKKLHK